MKQFYRAPFGPERALEDSILKCVPTLFTTRGQERWMGGSVPIGAGLPDILIAAWRPEIVAFSGADSLATSIVAYLRGVSFASLETIAFRIRSTVQKVKRCAQGLLEAEILSARNGNLALRNRWRNILPDVISVEVKVSNWRSAVAQAARNSIFAHNSYVAMPERAAAKLTLNETVKVAGLGIISVSGDDVKIIKRSKRTIPKVWQYYYKVATMVASDIADAQNDLRHFAR